MLEVCNSLTTMYLSHRQCSSNTYIIMCICEMWGIWDIMLHKVVSVYHSTLHNVPAGCISRQLLLFFPYLGTVMCCIKVDFVCLGMCVTSVTNVNVNMGSNGR